MYVWFRGKTKDTDNCSMLNKNITLNSFLKNVKVTTNYTRT